MSTRQLIDLPPAQYRVRAFDDEAGEPFTVAVCGTDLGWAESISATVASDKTGRRLERIVWIEVANWEPLP